MARCLVPAFDGVLFSHQWKDALKEIFHLQIRRGDQAKAERLAADIKNEELRRQAYEVIQMLERVPEDNTNVLKACAMNFTHDTFANAYPVE